MTLQNRVTPFGDIVAVPARGMFTGNRGIIHDPSTKTLLKRRWNSKAWLICCCVYKDVRREVMGWRTWTELFFLDEATALAAGHRPCFLCRRDSAEKFRAAWASGNATGRPRATEIDAALHVERLKGVRKGLYTSTAHPTDLPDGTMVTTKGSGEAFVVVEGKLYRWTTSGYSDVARLCEHALILTPPSVVSALRAGYRPILHPSLSSPTIGD